MGRPRKELDWQELESIVTRGGSLDYSAERQLIRWGEEVKHKTIKACREVIERRIKERFGCTFTEFKHKKMEPIRIGLQDKQIELAMKGNVTLLIWLGKQMLGQSDRPEEKRPNEQSNDPEVLRIIADHLRALKGER